MGPGRPYAANLFLVEEQGHGGPLRVLDLTGGHQGGVGAYPIVVPVSAHKAPVKAHVPAPDGGYDLQLGAYQVLLHYTIFIIQYLQDVELELVFCVLLTGQRPAACDHPQLLALDALEYVPFTLGIPCEMGQ